MRLKIKIARGFLRNVGENWSCNKASIIQLRFTCVRIVQHD